MTAQTPPIFLQAGSHPAEDVRRAFGSMMGNRSGIVASGHLAVSEKSGTPNMSVDVAEGQLVLKGSEGTYQGLYLCEARGTTNLAISAADATNPRRDLIIARVRDSAYSGATDTFSLEVVTGTPAGSPSDPSLPSGTCFVLARVQVAASASSITNANITDLRGNYSTAQYGRAAALGGTIPCTSSTRPTSPFAGLRIYETDTNRTWEHNGSAWVLMSSNGAYTSYTPTLTNITLGSGGVANGRWKVVDGSTLFLRVRITLGTSGAFTGAGTISLPSGMTGVTETDGFQIVPAILRDTGSAVYKGHVQLLSAGTSLTIYADNASGTYLTQAASSSVVPHTWANTDVIAFHGAFEIVPYTA